MEFSDNYMRVMRNMASAHVYNALLSYSVAEYNIYSNMLVADNNDPNNIEIPTTMFQTILNKLGINSTNTDELLRYKYVFPLIIYDEGRIVSGAETMLKYFDRTRVGRIAKCKSTKDEVYYGNNGIILDSNFNILFLSTISINANAENAIKYTIYLHPNVFTDDNGIINKSLSKKGIAYYLSQPVNWGGDKYTVKVEDPSRFLVKPNKPDVKDYDNSFNDVLKDNISDVLKQLTQDDGLFE